VKIQESRVLAISTICCTLHIRGEVRESHWRSLNLREFEEIGLIGPDLPDKDAVLFPEMLNGRLVLIHRIEPSIRLAYFEVDHFEKLAYISARSQYWTQYLRELDTHILMKPQESWEERKVGLGPPPIRTSEGWLIIYHGVDRDYVYRVGVALTDLDDPKKVIARSKTHILEPKKQGLVQNVVFPEAGMIWEKILYVFYGAADTACCVATAPIEELLEWLSNSLDFLETETENSSYNDRDKSCKKISVHPKSITCKKMRKYPTYVM
jgi:predicted GH43/DUF377 family glycosyl hydrolase